MAAQNPPKKHHYVPEFHLKRWAGEDNRIVQYKVEYGGPVSIRRKFPSETAFEVDLYRMQGVPPDEQQEFERIFLSRVDSVAADALRLFNVNDGEINLTERQRSAWTTYLLSLLHRMPEDIPMLKENFLRQILTFDEAAEAEYQEIRRPSDPDTAMDYFKIHAPASIAKQWTQLAATLISSKKISNQIFHMIWQIRHTPDDQYSLLLSDRPLVRTTVLGHTKSHMVLPIGPRRVFIACNTEKERDYFWNLSDSQLTRSLNLASATQSAKMAYALDETQNKFVIKHLATAPLESAHERYAKRLASIVP